MKFWSKKSHRIMELRGSIPSFPRASLYLAPEPVPGKALTDVYRMTVEYDTTFQEWVSSNAAVHVVFACFSKEGSPYYWQRNPILSVLWKSAYRLDSGCSWEEMDDYSWGTLALLPWPPYPVSLWCITHWDYVPVVDGGSAVEGFFCMKTRGHHLILTSNSHHL